MTERLDYNYIAPAGAKALGSVYGYITQSKLPATLINLIYLSPGLLLIGIWLLSVPTTARTQSDLLT